MAPLFLEVGYLTPISAILEDEVVCLVHLMAYQYLNGRNT
jgi:hypothetical protein